MKNYFGIALIISLIISSNAFAQRGLFKRLGNEVRQQGRQIIQKELGGFAQQGGSTQQGNQGQIKGFGGIPSESGRDSGGGSRQFNPGNGDFRLPGLGGGQQIQPNPGIQPGRSYPDLGQPIYRQPTQPIYHQPTQPIYHQPTQPIYHQPTQPIYQSHPIGPGQSNGQIVYPSDQHLPAERVIDRPSRVITHPSTSPGSPVASQQYIMIRCPQGCNRSFNYTLSSGGNSFAYSMYAGQEQRFPAGSGWTISFQEGLTHKRYNLEGGKVYTMKHENSQWKLRTSL